jgi:hypothetical protein
METPPEGEFMKQFSGSAAANGITMLIFAVLYGLKKCCDRPSRCKSKFHSCCLDIELSDRSQTSRKRPSITVADKRKPETMVGETQV